MTPSCVGRLSELLPGRATVNFEEQRGWICRPEELECVLAVGCDVRVKPSVSKPVYVGLLWCQPHVPSPPKRLHDKSIFPPFPGSLCPCALSRESLHSFPVHPPAHPSPTPHSPNTHTVRLVPACGP